MPALSHAAVLERVRSELRGSGPRSLADLGRGASLHPVLIATALGVLVDRGDVVCVDEARALFAAVPSPSVPVDPKEVPCAPPL